MPLFMAVGGPFNVSSYRQYPTTHIAKTMFQVEHLSGPLKIMRIQPSGRKVKVFERTT
jgi:hypothetical protein